METTEEGEEGGKIFLELELDSNNYFN